MWEVVCGALTVQCLRTDATLFVWILLFTLLLLLYVPESMLDEVAPSSEVSARRSETTDSGATTNKTTNETTNRTTNETTNRTTDETTVIEAFGATAHRLPPLVQSTTSRQRLMEDMLKSMQTGRQFATSPM